VCMVCVLCMYCVCIVYVVCVVCLCVYVCVALNRTWIHWDYVSVSSLERSSLQEYATTSVTKTM